MLKKVSIAGAVLALGVLAVSLFSPGASAQTPAATDTPSALPVVHTEGWPLWIQGRPAGLQPGGPNGWYFWHDDNGLHLVTTTPSDRLHVFTAVLTTDGVVRDVSKIRLEGADDIYVSPDGHRLVVKFHTWDGIDGVNFQVDGGRGLRLRLEEFGRLVYPWRVFAGRFSLHPQANPFTVLRSTTN